MGVSHIGVSLQAAFFKKDPFYDVDHFKCLLNLLHCFYFTYWLFGPEAHGILAPQPVIKPVAPARDGEVPTTGRQERPPNFLTALQLSPVLFKFQTHLDL